MGHSNTSIICNNYKGTVCLNTVLHTIIRSQDWRGGWQYISFFTFTSQTIHHSKEKVFCKQNRCIHFVDLLFNTYYSTNSFQFLSKQKCKETSTHFPYVTKHNNLENVQLLGNKNRHSSSSKAKHPVHFPKSSNTPNLNTLLN